MNPITNPLNDWSVWIVYRDKRNTTSHTYDEKKAAEIIQVLPDFGSY